MSCSVAERTASASSSARDSSSPRSSRASAEREISNGLRGALGIRGRLRHGMLPGAWPAQSGQLLCLLDQDLLRTPEQLTMRIVATHTLLGGGDLREEFPQADLHFSTTSRATHR